MIPRPGMDEHHAEDADDARHGDALAGYLKLFAESSDSETLAKRIYQNAVRQGDFAAALKSIRFQELKNDVPPEGPLLLFTDAFQKRRWSLALLAADELGASWVRVNGIRPGLIRTDLVEVILNSPEVAEDYRQCTPLPRVGEVTDVANMALFLLSDAAAWITGQVINVDGGHGLRRGPDMSAMLAPIFGEDGLRGVVN